MVGGAGGGRGTARQWAMFDPVANAQALAEVQAQALRAAGELVERLALSVDGARERDGAAGDAGSGGSPPREGATPAGDALRLVETWIDLLQRASASFARATDGSGPANGNGNGHGSGDGTAAPGGAANGAPAYGAVLLDVHGDVDGDTDGGGARAPIRIELDDAGHGEAEVWVHNGTKLDTGALTLHAGDLVAPDGTRLDATVTCDPTTIESLPGRSSRGVTVSAHRRAGSDARSGTYRGLIQVDGTTDLWLVVEAVVP